MNISEYKASQAVLWAFAWKEIGWSYINNNVVVVSVVGVVVS